MTLTALNPTSASAPSPAWRCGLLSLAMPIWMDPAFAGVVLG